jgi:hypothetical protein
MLSAEEVEVYAGAGKWLTLLTSGQYSDQSIRRALQQAHGRMQRK